ncbi:MAG: glycosyltransferase [Gammaproteobacteria bacterium]|jgi:hypothetical protein|nr:glycosyltransferase [Thiotrichales bacterium]MBT5636354.1 glycosyltransferase [Gammaproteobacteria bacterium]MBT5745350.1 glycosyltransferase [Gammaproteobacteria bacterium]MBT7230346.1 glycosyltransferase [Gammaproteobacteria bacterium]
MKRDLIVFGEDWGGLPSSTQHLIRRLSEGRKVVWVNSIGLRQPHLTLHDLKRGWKKLFTPRSPAATTTSPPSEPFEVIHPRTIPAPRSRIARWIAVKLLIRQILPVVNRLQLHRPILWTSLPTAADLHGELGESALLYYCGDDFSGLAGVDHNTIAAHEAKLSREADLILVASERLTHRFPPSTTQLVPHGVDYTLFTTPTQPATDLPNNGHPTAGFYGSISSWLDQELLCNTMQRLPEWNFVLIGRVECDLSRLEGIGNLTLLGERPHHQLPRYSQHWDVSILPFLDNRQIRACNPLKLREYLAAGRPVVSTPFPASTPYLDHLQQVNSPEEMANALQQSLEDTCSEERRASVCGETWSARANQIEQHLEAL